MAVWDITMQKWPPCHWAVDIIRSSIQTIYQPQGFLFFGSERENPTHELWSLGWNSDCSGGGGMFHNGQVQETSCWRYVCMWVHAGIFPDILNINGAQQDNGCSLVFSRTELNSWNAKENVYHTSLISLPSSKLNNILQGCAALPQQVHTQSTHLKLH